MQDLKNIITKFEEIVSPFSCNKLAKECGLIQRASSKIYGHEFAQAMVIPNAFLEAETLNSLAERMNDINSDCDLSASALAQRINTAMSVRFMQACFGRVLKEIIKHEIIKTSDLSNISKVFKRILIEDSTRGELNEKLSPFLKGSGGVASNSAFKLNFIFNYLSEEFIDLTCHSGNEPDQKIASNIIPLLEKDDLVIRDLGYFVLKRLQEIEEKGAYYVSRWKVNELVYESKESKTPLNLALFLEQNMFKGMVDINVFVGRDKHPVRLIACLLDEESINKRKRIANKDAQRRGTKTSKKKADLLKYSIFITNVLAEILTTSEVMSIYRARWRVEMIFKSWKSCLSLHFFKGKNIERFYCLLYGRLIMCLLLGKIYPILLQYTFNLKRELSDYKLINYLIADHSFARAFQEGKMDSYINKLLKAIPRRLCKDKRKRPTLRQSINAGRGYYKLETSNLGLKVA